MVEKIKEFIDDNWIYALLAFVIVFVFCFFGTLIHSIMVDKEQTIEFSKTLTDSEKVEIFTSCYTSFDFNCSEAVKAYRKLKMK